MATRDRPPDPGPPAPRRAAPTSGPAGNAVEQVRRLFRLRGGGARLRELVSPRAHALQCAALARRHGQPAPLVAAALLHDVGHLLLGPPDIAGLHHDARHEQVGADWLEQRFGAGVAGPVRLHVAAKRYLCAVEPGYLARLSQPSLHSLWLQGGPMNAAERARFEASRGHRQALLLRRLDDEARVPGAAVPGLEDYEPLLHALACECAASAAVAAWRDAS